MFSITPAWLLPKLPKHSPSHLQTKKNLKPSIDEDANTKRFIESQSSSYAQKARKRREEFCPLDI